MMDIVLKLELQDQVFSLVQLNNDKLVQEKGSCTRQLSKANFCCTHACLSQLKSYICNLQHLNDWWSNSWIRLPHGLQNSDKRRMTNDHETNGGAQNSIHHA